MPERPTADPVTDQTTKRLDSEPRTEQGRKAWLDLSFPQVLGGALAAMTAAALGSRFGVEGTIIGTALASVVAAVATAFYTASLRRTSETVRVVLARRPGDAGLASRPTTPLVSRGSTAVAPGSLSSPAGTADRSTRPSRRRAILVRSVVGALATFALAAGALTMYEALAGQAVSGGSGTTFSQVQQREREDRPADDQAPAPGESADPGSTAEPSPEPSITSEAESTPTAEPSAEATDEASGEPSGRPSAEPSVSAEAEPSAPSDRPSTAPTQAPR